jgi:hypothetical protein
MKSYHVAIAAEAFAAGLFAQLGHNVLVQYGANQPGYDLSIEKDHKSIHVSVKGSQDGAWGLAQNYKNKERTYHEAIDKWVDKNNNLVFCFVQFLGVEFGGCPKVYIAKTIEVAYCLKEARNGIGDTVLYENYSFLMKGGARTTSAIPEKWKISEKRVSEMFL